MNQRDRERMGRLYAAMAQWPWPNRMRTVGAEDLSIFFRRMEQLQPLFQRAVMAISRCDVEDPDAELDELESAFAAWGEIER